MFTEIEITSNDFKEYIGKTRVEFKYWIDTNNTWWYCYNDIIEFIELNKQVADNIYYQKLTDDEKREVWDCNNFVFNVQRPVPRRFVTKEVVRRLINRNNERNNKLMKVINNLEYRFNSTEINNDYIAERMDKLEKSLNKPYDYEDVFIQAYELVQTPTAREVLDKLGKIDREKEEIVDEFREYIYDDYYDEIEIEVKLNKRDENNELNEEGRVIYKKNKSKESTVPSWIKNLIK